MNKEITIKKIIGFENLEKQFQNIILLRNNQTWMLIGRKGIGKRTLSMRFAGFVINNFNKKWEETSLTNKIFKKETDNLFYITSFDEKSSGKISKDQIDIISSKMRLFSANANNRVIIIDKFNWLTNNAMNSMLKLLEEPPKGVYFFLIVDELINVLPTIQSRSQKLFFHNHSFGNCKKIINENSLLEKEEEEDIDNLVKLSNFSPGISMEISSFSGIQLYKNLLDTFLEKDKIRDCAKKFISNTKNQISNVWIVEFLLKRLLSNCLRYSIDNKSIKNSFILNENNIVIHILNNKNNHELLELLEDLNYRLKRIKSFNSSLEFEVFQYLNKFH